MHLLCPNTWMGAWKAVRAQLLRQQRWMKCVAVAAIGVTAVALLLSFVGTDSSQIRSSGLITFDTADKSTSSLIARHVVKLKEARDSIVNSFWSWDSPFDKVEEEMRGAYGQEPGQLGSWRDPGGYWDENAQVWVQTASRGYWDEHADAWVEPAQSLEATLWDQSEDDDQAEWQEAVQSSEEEPQWQEPPEGQEQQARQPGSWRDPGGYWDEDAQVWVQTASRGYWDEHADAWVEPAQSLEATSWDQPMDDNKAGWQEAVPGSEEEPQWQETPGVQDAAEWQLPPAETQAEAWGDSNVAEPAEKQWDSAAKSWRRAKAASTGAPPSEEGGAVLVDMDSWDGSEEAASSVWDGADNGWQAAGEDEGQENASQDTDAEPGAQEWQEGAESAEVWSSEDLDRWSKDASQGWEERDEWVEPAWLDQQGSGSDESAVWGDSAQE